MEENVNIYIYTHRCITESVHHTPETDTALKANCISTKIQKKEIPKTFVFDNSLLQGITPPI